MASDGKSPIRLSWDEWKNGRAARREALSGSGLPATCRRTTAKPRAIAALNALLQGQVKDAEGRAALRRGRVQESIEAER